MNQNNQPEDILAPVENKTNESVVDKVSTQQESIPPNSSAGFGKTILVVSSILVILVVGVVGGYYGYNIFKGGDNLDNNSIDKAIAPEIKKEPEVIKVTEEIAPEQVVTLNNTQIDNLVNSDASSVVENQVAVTEESIVRCLPDNSFSPLVSVKSDDLTDSDEDTVSDYEEVIVYGTNPCLKDTDGDTYNDGIELCKGYNPNGSGVLSLDLPKKAICPNN